MCFSHAVQTDYSTTGFFPLQTIGHSTDSQTVVAQLSARLQQKHKTLSVVCSCVCVCSSSTQLQQGPTVRRVPHTHTHTVSWELRASTQPCGSRHPTGAASVCQLPHLASHVAERLGKLSSSETHEKLQRRFSASARTPWSTVLRFCLTLGTQPVFKVQQMRDVTRRGVEDTLVSSRTPALLLSRWSPSQNQ